jgi:hypothetical protein
MPREDEREKILRLILDKHCRESLQSGQAVDAGLLEARRCAAPAAVGQLMRAVRSLAVPRPVPRPRQGLRAALCIKARLFARVQERMRAPPRAEALRRSLQGAGLLCPATPCSACACRLPGRDFGRLCLPSLATLPGARSKSWDHGAARLLTRPPCACRMRRWSGMGAGWAR